MSGEADDTLAARDPAVPGLGLVLDPEAVLALHARAGGAHGTAPRVAYVRYKPGTSCLTSVDATIGAGIQTIVARAFASDAGGQAALRGAVTHAREAGALAAIDGDRHVVLTVFPHDRAIPGLARLHDPALRSRLYARLQLSTVPVNAPPRRLVYKPGRRYVAAVELDGRPIAAIKCGTTRDAGRAGPIPRWLDGSAGVHAAPMLAEYARRSVRAMTWLPGTLLADRMAAGASGLADVQRVGGALAALHAGPASGNAAHELVAWTDRPAAGDPASLRGVVRDLAWLLPSEARRLNALADALVGASSTCGGRAVPIHGDFYAKQVLVDHDRIGLIDFDEATLGDAHVDLALFLAHVERDVDRGRLTERDAAGARSALLDGYVDAGGELAPSALELRLADALLRLTPHPFRHREPAWPERMRALIDRAERALTRAQAPSRARGRATPRPAGAAETVGASPVAAPGHPIEVPAPCASEASAGSDGDRSPPCSGHTARARRVEPSCALDGDASLAFAGSLLDVDAARAALGMRRLAPPGEVSTVRAVRLVRHKPGRRAVLHFDVTTNDRQRHSWFGKVRARGADLRVHRLATRLREAGLDGHASPVGIPRPRGVVEAFRLVLHEHAPGVVATALLLGDAAPATLGAQMAGAMLALHRAPVRSGRSRTARDECVTVVERLDAWALDAPEHAPAIARLSQRCWQLAQPLHDRPAVALLHRDLHPDQLLIDGARTWILDLDLAADGDPALDAGNMIAHLIELGVRHPGHAASLSTAASTFATSAIAGGAGHLAADAVTRYALLSLARLCEIARRYPERRAIAPTLLHRVLDLTDRPIDVDFLCRSFSMECGPCA